MTEADPQPLTALQVEVLRVLWRANEATVVDVRHALVPRRELALTTVATLLKRLDARGFVAFRQEGRQYIYRALISEDEVAKRTVDEALTQVFEGDLPAFAAQLLARKDVRPGDLERIRALIEEREVTLGKQPRRRTPRRRR